MTRVLVTGGAGFIGRPTLSELVRRGYDVHALTTRTEPEAVEGVRWQRVDLHDSTAVDALVESVQPEQLVHLAWHVAPGEVWNASMNVVWVERSLALLRAFVRGGGHRAVIAGTCAEYDWAPATAALNEHTSPLRPSSLYGVAKDGLRRVASGYAERVGVELAWARVFFVYGPREPVNRVVPTVIRALLADVHADLTRGTQIRDFLHVDDVAGAIVSLLGSAVVGPVNIASGEAVTIAAVADELGRLLRRPDLIRCGALPDRRDDPPRVVADISRLREEVGFFARWRLPDGLADTASWWREHAA